jgi:hypothetical protein
MTITTADLWASATKYHPDDWSHGRDFGACPHPRCVALREALGRASARIPDSEAVTR